MYKISIIIPIYNAQEYLDRSIKSIQKQTLRDIQIILVNDGSFDNSLAICKKYEQKDNRILVVDKVNGGVSSARNAGLEVAKGKYVGFIDPDDWIESDMYENLYRQIENVKADMGICNYVIENNGKSTKVLLNIKKDILAGEEITQQIIYNLVGNPSLNSDAQIMGSVWRLIIKKDIIDLNSIQFDVEIPLMEDLLFSIQVLLKSERVTVNNGAYYHYVTNSNSAVTSYREDMNKTQKYFFNKLEKNLQSLMKSSSVEKRLKLRYLDILIISIINEAHKDNKKSFKEKVAMIETLCKDTKIKSILKDLKGERATLAKKIMLKAVEHENGLYLLVYYIVITRFLK